MSSQTLGRAPDRSDLRPINHTTLRVWEWGDEHNDTIICAHGAFDHGRMFDDLAPRLADDGWHVVAYDARGHGDSGRLSSGHSWEAMVVDLAVLARSFDGPVGLIGHSMGASVVTQIGATFPELARWIINLDGLGPPKLEFDDDQLADFASAAIGNTMRTSTRGHRHFPDLTSMAEQRGKINYRMPKPWTEHLAEHGAQEGPGGWTWKWDAQFSLTMPSGYSVARAIVDYPRVSPPILVLTGAEKDQWGDLPADEAERRVEMFQNATHHRMVGGGHYLHLEKPDETYELIKAFIDANATDGGAS